MTAAKEALPLDIDLTAPGRGEEPAVTAATELTPEATTPALKGGPAARCLRCGGRMLVGGADGDSACFTCGNVVYRLAPLVVADPDRRERRPYHAGRSLA